MSRNKNQPTPVAPQNGPGALRWGIKSSFIRYVNSAPDGVRTVHGVVELPTEQGAEFEFPFAGATSGPGGELVLAFSGSVHFQAHHGMLDVTIKSPTVTFKDGWADVTIQADPAGESGEAVRIAKFESDLPCAVGGRVLAGSMEVFLTTRGSQLLGDVYPARTLLEPLAIDANVQHATQ